MDDKNEYNPQRWRKRPVAITAKRMKVRFEVETLEGTMQGDAGDWLITGIQGEQYPCKDEIFRASYELAESGDEICFSDPKTQLLKLRDYLAESEMQWNDGEVVVDVAIRLMSSMTRDLIDPPSLENARAIKKRKIREAVQQLHFDGFIEFDHMSEVTDRMMRASGVFVASDEKGSQ